MSLRTVVKRYLPPVGLDLVEAGRRTGVRLRARLSRRQALRRRAEPLVRAYPTSDAQRAIPIPPAELGYLVSGEVLGGNPFLFLPSGKRAHDRVLDALQSAGVALDAHPRILDWGCGCGRVTRHWLAHRDTHEIAGCDINAKMIDWCRRNLDFAEFTTIGIDPPTPFPDRSFDLVVGTSVLTHLGLGAQIVWMRELWRILAPGGVAVLTVQGPYGLATRSIQDGRVGCLIDNEVFVAKAAAREGSNAFLAASTPGAFERVFAPFEVLWYCPLHEIMGQQDTFVLRKGRDSSVRGVPADPRDALRIDLAAGQRAAETELDLDGQQELISFVRVDGYERRPIDVRIAVADDATAGEVGSCRATIDHPKAAVYRTLRARFEGPVAAGRHRVRVEATPGPEPQSADASAVGSVAFCFTSVW